MLPTIGISLTFSKASGDGRFDIEYFWNSMDGEARRCGRDVGDRFQRHPFLYFRNLLQGAVRLAGFAHLAAGPFGQTGCFLSPEIRDR